MSVLSVKVCRTISVLTNLSTAPVFMLLLPLLLFTLNLLLAGGEEDRLLMLLAGATETIMMSSIKNKEYS